MDIGFLIKKFIGGMVMPMSIVFLLGVIGLLFLFMKRYNYAKVFLVASFVILFVFSYNPISNALISNLEYSNKALVQIPKDIKYIAVLGSGHKSDDNISIISQMDESSLARVSEGVLLYHKIGNVKLIFSGYSGDDTVPHAFMQKKLSIELGVNEEDIITFANPKDTYEEALAIKELLGNEPFILVTSAFHMSRALDTFHLVGLSPIPAPTGHKSSNVDYLKRPSGYDMQKSEAAVWEYLGLLFNKLKSLI